MTNEQLLYVTSCAVIVPQLEDFKSYSKEYIAHDNIFCASPGFSLQEGGSRGMQDR
jgi:hypothetical protein